MEADIEARLRATARLRELRGEIYYRGRRSFIPVVNLAKNPKRGCNLKKHFKYGTCAYELAGYLESQVERFYRPDRFIFHSMETLEAACFKGERVKNRNFSRRDFWYAMALLRAIGVASPLVECEGHKGLIVAPHNALFEPPSIAPKQWNSEKRCRYAGPMALYRGPRGLTGWFEFRPSGDAIWHPDSEKIACEK